MQLVIEITVYFLYKKLQRRNLFTPSQATPLDIHGSFTGEIPCNPLIERM